MTNNLCDYTIWMLEIEQENACFKQFIVQVS